MSIIVYISGQPFTIPQNNDVNWGINVTNWINAISAATLQTNGGNFNLTADANFGTTAGLIASYFKSVSNNISQSGIVRLAQTDSITWRNTTNSSDLVLAVNSSNQLTFNNAPLNGASINSVGIAGSNGITVSNSPLSTSGTIGLSLGSITPTAITTGSGVFSNLQVLSNSSLNVQVQSGGSGNAAWLSLNAVGGTAYTGINFIDKNINKFSTFIDTTAGGTNLSFRMALDEINNKDFIVAIPNGNLVLGPAQNLTIDQNGNVGIVGTGNAAQLYIYSAGAGNGAGIVIDNSNSGNTFAQTSLQVNGTTKYTYGQVSNSFFIADYVSTTPVDFVYYQNGSLKLGSAQNFVISSSGALSVTSSGIAATINGGLTVNSPGNSVVLNGSVANNTIGYVLNNTAGREWVLGAVGSAASSYANGFWIFDTIVNGVVLGIDSNGSCHFPTGQATFTNSPIAPTPSTSDNSTKVATTAYVQNNFGIARKVWATCNFNGNGTLNWGSNITSLTNYGGLVYSVTFGSAVPGTNYTVAFNQTGGANLPYNFVKTTGSFGFTLQTNTTYDLTVFY